MKSIYYCSILLVICIGSLFVVNMQSVQAQTITRTQPNASLPNVYNFNANLTPPIRTSRNFLRQPSILYFWNFRDGTYSFDVNPIHTYYRTGTFRPVVEGTRIYSDEDDEDELKRVIGAPVVLSPSQIVSVRPNARRSLGGDPLKILTSRMPKANDSITYVITYRNTCSTPITGNVSFQFNTAQYNFSNVHAGNTNFVNGQETYHGEVYSSTQVQENSGLLRWSFSNMAPGVQRNIFVTLATKSTVVPGSLVDCTASVNAGCVNNSENIALRSVKSHDPNEMYSDREYICPNTQQEVTYTIEFQNTGTGPATNILIVTPVSANYLLNTATVQEINIGGVDIPNPNSEYPMEMGVDRLSWGFLGQNLEGTQQAGIGEDFTLKDTKGYIKFTIQTADFNTPACSNIPCYANIRFDCNTPITTEPHFIPIRRLGCIEDCAQCDIFLAGSGESSGQSLSVDPTCEAGLVTDINYSWYPLQNGNAFATTGDTFIVPDSSTTYIVSAWVSESIDIGGTLIETNWTGFDYYPVFISGGEGLLECYNGMSIDATTTPASCAGGVDGEINITVNSGTSPYYLYGLFDSGFECVPLYDTQNINIDVQQAGIYTFGISDNDGCFQDATVTVEEPKPLHIDQLVTASDCSNFNVRAIATGGTPPYTYTWNDSNTTSDYRANLPTGIYIVTATDARDCTYEHVVVNPETKRIQLRAFLEGAYTPGSSFVKMTSQLSGNSVLPTEQPFNTAPWNYTGTEAIPLSNEVYTYLVDWILIELRDANNFNTVVSQKAALVYDLGYVVDAALGAGIGVNSLDNGLTIGALGCDLVEGQSYYVVLRQRNHLDVMSAVPITVANGILEYDFTIDSLQAYGTGQLKEMDTGEFAMHGGDFNGDGVLSVSDFNLYVTQTSLINEYVTGDLNLDRTVSVTDFNYYLPNSSIIGTSAIRY